jgi:hypothetical protein
MTKVGAGLVAVGGYEGVQPGVLPFAVGTGCQFVHHAAAALCVTAEGGREFKDGAISIDPAATGRAVEIAFLVKD